MSADENEQRLKLLDLVRAAVSNDTTLREKYQIGDKFRFVRDRLQALLEQLEKHQEAKQAETKQLQPQVQTDETLVFVYLYNAQGISLPTWGNMLTPKLFYEYSVNRPIYANKAQVESLIQAKANRTQHAYITVAVKQSDMVKSENAQKDPQGNPIVRVREGGLKFDRFISLTYSNTDYVLREAILVKKP